MRARGKRPERDTSFDFEPATVVGEAPDAECFLSPMYQVVITPLPNGWLWLSIKRRDKQSVHDWRVFQRIKTVLCGAEREALELYPAESRVVDTSNQYHLWVMPVGDTFPFGWKERCIVDGNGKTKVGAARQRPLPAFMKPTLTRDEVERATRDIKKQRGYL